MPDLYTVVDIPEPDTRCGNVVYKRCNVEYVCLSVALSDSSN